MTKIYLSASSINDYLECSMRYYYRRFRSSEAVTPYYMTIGTIVHQALEKFWSDEKKALEFARFSSFDHPLTDKHKSKIFKHIKNYFKYFHPLVNKEDKVERFFTLQIDTDIFLRGKFDRLVGDKIFDWKTSEKPPYTVDNDVQFIIYNYAYRKLYNERPSGVYYAALKTGELISFNQRIENERILFKEIIPKMVADIKAENYIHEGKLKFFSTCQNCQYKETCWDELARGNLDFRTP